MKRYALVLLAALCMLLLAACGTQKTDAPDTPDEPDAPAVEPTPVTPGKTPEELAEERLNERIASMTLEEKVGQLFFVRCPETGAAEDVKSYHLGGLLLFSRDYKDANGNYLTKDAFTAAVQSYQDAADIPLLRWVFNAGLVIWLMGLCVLHAMYAGRWKRFAVLLLPVLLWGTYLLGPVVQGRYVYPFVCLLPLMLAVCKTKEE